MSAGGSAGVVAVTVTYGNRVAEVVNTVLRAIDAGVSQVLVVLNGCTPSVESEIRGRLEAGARVVYLSSPINLGSAGGFRLGLEGASRSDADYVWILDDDNWCESTTLRAALAAMSSLEREVGVGGAAVSCLRRDSHPHRLVEAGEDPSRVFPQPGSALVFDLRRKLTRRAVSSSNSARRELIEVPFSPYGGLLVPRAALNSCLPSPELVLYEDDWDFSERLRASGIRIFLALNAPVCDSDGGRKASESGEGGRVPPVVRLLRAPKSYHWRIYYQMRNRAYLSRRRTRSVSDHVWFFVNLAAFLSRITAVALSSRGNRVAYACVLRGVADGLMGRLGRTWPLP